MKKLLIAVVVLVVSVVWLVNTKTDEAGRNKDLGQACFEAACGGQGACAEVVAYMYPDFCFNAAYRISPVPGKDTIDLDTLLKCMNDRLVAGNFEVATTKDASPLGIPASDPLPETAGIVFTYDDEKLESVRERVRRGF